jgi:hypothetical protein
LGVHYEGATTVVVRHAEGTARLRVPADVLDDTGTATEPTDLARTTRTLFDRNYEERG